MYGLYSPLSLYHKQMSYNRKKKKLDRIRTEIVSDSIDLPKIATSIKKIKNDPNSDFKKIPKTNRQTNIKNLNIISPLALPKKFQKIPKYKNKTLLPYIFISNNDNEKNNNEYCKKNIICSERPNNQFNIFGISNTIMNTNFNNNKKKAFISLQKPNNFSHAKMNIKEKSHNIPIKLKLILNSNSNFSIKSEENETNENNKYGNIIKNYLQIETIYQSKNNYASCTQKGLANYSSDIEKISPKLNNQDRSIILNNICDVENYSIYGIMDGHGSNGHYVSEFIKTKIEEIFCNKSLYTNNPNKKLNILIIKEKLSKNNYKLIKDFYKEVNEKLDFETFDVSFSGSTCLLIFKLENEIICSNTGDSRSILIENLNKITQLNIEHKPEIPEEKERIENFGGVVSQCNDKYDDGMEGGPYRVWQKGCDYPGLAMSRSIGDKVSKNLGVINNPEIKIYNIDDNKICYLVMASDGIWEYISNEQVMKICNNMIKEGDIKNACVELIKESFKEWLDLDNRVDDITVNIILLSKLQKS